MFDQRLEAIQAVTRQYMALLNSLLIDSEAVHTSTLNEVAAERQWYQDQHSKLVAFQSQLDDFLA